jgi:hypothetical protein
MSMINTISRTVATAAVISAGVLGLPVAAAPTSSVSSFITSVLVAPVAEHAGSASFDAAIDGSAADRFVSSVLARTPDQVTNTDASEVASNADADSVNRFVQRVLVRNRAD